jgi:hypothetical protein
MHLLEDRAELLLHVALLEILDLLLEALGEYHLKEFYLAGEVLFLYTTMCLRYIFFLSILNFPQRKLAIESIRDIM